MQYTCPLCNNTAELFTAGTLLPEQFFSQKNVYAIAESERKKQLPLYACIKCGHGFTPIDIDPLLIEKWYQNTEEDLAFLADEEARRVTARTILKKIGRYIAPHGHLLDVGCGAGIFVSEAARCGWDAAGLEASVRAVEWGREKFGISLTTGNMDSFKTMPPETFDVITMFDVIEHVADPAQFIELVSRVLKPSGWLIITTPKFDSFLARFMGKHWYCIFPAHIHYFTSKSLHQVLHQSGFKIVNSRAHTRYLSLGYFGQRLLGLINPNYQIAHTKFHSTIIPVNLGDEFEVYAQKIS